jgi:hypothetical protein
VIHVEFGMLNSQAKKCTVTKYVIQTSIALPFSMLQMYLIQLVQVHQYITLAYVHTHMKLFHNTSYLIRQKKKKFNMEWFTYRFQNQCSFILHWKSM